MSYQISYLLRFAFVCLLIAGANGVAAQEKAPKAPDTESDVLLYIPDSLKDLLSRSDAVITGHVAKVEDVRWEDRPPVRTDGRGRVSKQPLVGYSVRVDDVLFLRPNVTPLVKSGDVIHVDNEVSHEGLRDAERGEPLHGGDECVFFLFRWRNGWMFAPWQVQYRRLQDQGVLAVAVKPGFEQRVFGPVTAQKQGDKMTVVWDDLVQKIKEAAPK
jgi:hypothetical protein